MDEKVFDQPIRDRGMSLVGFVVESVTLDDESNEKIDKYELAGNAFMQQGSLVGDYGKAMKDAANNANGAVGGMMGVGMVGMASGGVVGGAATGPFQNQGPTANVDPYGQNTGVAAGVVAESKADEGTINSDIKFCPNCGEKSTGGNFCTKCGTKLN